MAVGRHLGAVDHQVPERVARGDGGDQESGLVPGLWLDVIELRSMAAQLGPTRRSCCDGVRGSPKPDASISIRHPAARAHLDATVNRLVTDFGVGMSAGLQHQPGPGTDHDAPSVGAGLPRHNRALLDWLDGVLDQHPDLIIENCSSGAMRADFMMLSRLSLQSTSDQQDPARYPTIAAAAPMLMLPEQAGSWAYPAADMSLEETALTLQAGLLGRLYLSGYLHRLRPEQLSLVHQAVAAHKAVRAQISISPPRAGRSDSRPGTPSGWRRR